jgi:hypothetical protein
MSKILRITENDYRIKVRDNGNITLDTGVDQGTVIVTGNLLVKGTQTTVSTTNLDIEDNVIVLNKGELGSGVTEGSAGIQIDRGSLADSLFVWDETIDKFVIKLDTNVLSGIVVGNIATDPTTDLDFDMQLGAGVLRVINSAGYESRVTAPDDIPNKKYVNDYVFASGGAAVVKLIQFPVNVPYGASDTLVEAASSNIRFYVRSGGSLNQQAQITAAGLDVNNVNILSNTILNSSAGNNLVLTATNSHVEIDGVLNLDDRVSDPTATGGTSRIYSKSVAVGEQFNSGVFVRNSRTQDELVVKNRALLLSMLF